MPDWERNHGSCPGHLLGTSKRMAVKLRNGMTMGLEPLAAGTPAGWPCDADKGYKTRWTLTGDPFDIVEYRIL